MPLAARFVSGVEGDFSLPSTVLCPQGSTPRLDLEAAAISEAARR
ncbi:hypothetical protein NKH18_01020 [Streptomyces sp. M10(2022)]